MVFSIPLSDTTNPFDSWSGICFLIILIVPKQDKYLIEGQKMGGDL